MDKAQPGGFCPHHAYPIGDEKDDDTVWIPFERIKGGQVHLVIENISDSEHRREFESYMCSLRDQLATGIQVGDCLVEGVTIREWLAATKHDYDWLAATVQ